MKVLEALKLTLKNKKVELIIAIAMLTLLFSGIVYYLYPGAQTIVELIARATVAYTMSYFVSLIGFGEVDWKDEKFTPAKIGHLVVLIATAIIFSFPL